jgi:hypothetical protein
VQLLPTHCRGCGAIALTPLTTPNQVQALCASCGQLATVVPGPRFGEHERQLFGELTALARSAELRPAEAQRLCIDIEMGLATTDQLGTLERVSRRFPQLTRAVPRLLDSPALQARTLRMLETILNALSSPSKSLTLPVAPVARRHHA